MADQQIDETEGGQNGLESARETAIGVMTDAQQRLKAGANQVAERFPEALSGAQSAARDTQRTLDGMSDDALLAGAGFSVGMAVGLFVGGVNRLLILLSLIPAAAMAATLAGRRQADTSGAAASGRRTTAG